MNSDANGKLKLSTKLGFGAGDIFGGGSLMIVGIFYLYFLTDIVRITPILAGTVFLISKGWDAISDPLMGYISDRTRSRFGRRRPYFLVGVVLIFVSFFMMWYPVSFESEMARFSFVVVAYVFFSTAYTVTMIPYFALSSELTTDYNERTSLTSFRMAFSMGSTLVCAVLPKPIIDSFATKQTGYIVMALIFGLFFSLPFLATFFTTKERKEFQREPVPFNFKRTFVVPFKTPTFVNALLMYLFALMSLDVVMSVIRYFLTYYLKRDNETMYVLGTLAVTQLLCIPIVYLVGQKIGKRKTFLFATAYMLILMLASFSITPEMHSSGIYVFAFMVGIASSALYVIIYSIMPDIPDVDELYSGQRQEGIYSGLMTFCRKLGSALGIFIVSVILELSGFVKPVSVQETIDGELVTRLVKQPQPPEVYIALKLIFTLVPLVFLSLAIYNTVRYRLTPQIHNRLNRLLTAKRTGLDYSLEEENLLKRVLERKTEL